MLHRITSDTSLYNTNRNVLRNHPSTTLIMKDIIQRRTRNEFSKIIRNRKKKISETLLDDSLNNVPSELNRNRVIISKDRSMSSCRWQTRRILVEKTSQAASRSTTVEFVSLTQKTRCGLTRAKRLFHLRFKYRRGGGGGGGRGQECHRNEASVVAEGSRRDDVSSSSTIGHPPNLFFSSFPPHSPSPIPTRHWPNFLPLSRLTRRDFSFHLLWRCAICGGPSILDSWQGFPVPVVRVDRAIRSRVFSPFFFFFFLNSSRTMTSFDRFQ